jgi:hypothetical protein
MPQTLATSLVAMSNGTVVAIIVQTSSSRGVKSLSVSPSARCAGAMPCSHTSHQP